MAIDTDNGKLAVMELDIDWEPALPLSPGALAQDDQQQLLWGFPEVLWGDPSPEPEGGDGPVAGTFSLPSVLLYLGEDCALLLTGLSYVNSAGDTVYLNDADCDYVVRTAAGATVTTGTLDYADSDGRYEGVIDATVTEDLTEGGLYSVSLTIREGERDGYRRLETRAEYRVGT